MVYKFLDLVAPEQRGLTQEDFLNLKLGDHVFYAYFNDNIDMNFKSIAKIVIKSNFYQYHSPKGIPPNSNIEGSWQVKVLELHYYGRDEPIAIDTEIFVRDRFEYGWGKSVFYTQEEADAWLNECEAAWNAADKYREHKTIENNLRNSIEDYYDDGRYESEYISD